MSPRPGRAEQRVRERVGDHVPVGMAREPARMLDRDAAEDERNAVREGVCVDSDPDAKLAHTSEASACGSEARSSSPHVASGGVRWSRPHGPRRTCTATSPAAAAGRTSLSTRSPT